MRKHILLSISGLVIFGFLVFLFRSSSSQLAEGQNNVLTLFLTAKQVEATLEKDVLKSRNFLLSSYDPIVSIGNEFESVCSQLRSKEIFIYQNLDSGLDTAVDSYCDSIEDTMEKIERFKSHNSVLRNSIYYLQKIVTEQSANDKERVSLQQMDLESRIIQLSLAYALVPTPESRKTLGNLLNQFQKMADSHRTTERATVVHLHASRIFETKERIEDLTSEIVNSNANELLEKIRDVYFQNYSKAEKDAGLYRQLLFAACTLFLVFVLYNITLLWQAANQLTAANSNLEEKVKTRTVELEKSQETIIQQQQAIIASAKMSSLGEMAGGVAHEINTPLAIIKMRVEQLEECISDGASDEIDMIDTLKVIKGTTDRIAKIVSGLRFFAADGKKAPAQPVSFNSIIEETLNFCREKFATHGVQLDRADGLAEGLTVDCRSVEISQVLLNLLNNAFDAISGMQEKWIRIETIDRDSYLEICIIDSGSGIPQDVRDKIMQPFFTTKEIGKGTGLGLSISKGIIESHGGKLSVDASHPNTCFVIILPKSRQQESSVKETA